MNTNIELGAMNASDSTSMDEMDTNEKTVSADSEDVSKYKKISAHIPKLITVLEQLEMLDQSFEMNFELKKSRKRFASIVTDNVNPNAEDIEEFIDLLSSALYGLSAGLRVIDMNTLMQEKKSRAVDLLADISLIQEDIAKLAG
ncbi:hypothetical protein [Legionella cincinnatiensis]|uniref:Uncharacterized protein n=1 Tax=Legionella cincinnatiensis TaxID=28085 RepID=A0A378IQE5_9GAMM|nr:hypothetical protein [Legionella cincinnatiensis]KTC82803.1 hypothetical protein Lcin_2832 [Legionella cincinnatiensis]STX34234.1 Uncharacterised protein [Legionella cincinnatiensis]